MTLPYLKRPYFMMLALLMLASCGIKGADGATDSTNAEERADTATITLLFAGDMMQHAGQIKAAAVAGGYDYSDCFAQVKDQIEAADLAIANLEVTLGGAPYRGYPQFCAPDEFAQAIKDAGFDILTTSNNHCCDTGSRGLGRTLTVLDSLDIPSLGTYRNAEDRAKRYPLLVEKNGFRLALLAYTYGTNGLPVPAPYVVNLIDTVQMAQDIASAKAMKPDAIIAFMHWGTEYVLRPVNSQQRQADWLLSHGVDHVIGGHPHVVQPIEMREDAKGNSHLVVWSLGNYISNMTKDTTFGGLMVTLKLSKVQSYAEDTTVSMANGLRPEASYSLVWTSRPAVSGHKNHHVYPISVADSLLNSRERQMRDFFAKTARNLFDKYNLNINEQEKP